MTDADALNLELERRLASRHPRLDAIQESLQAHFEATGADPLAVGVTRAFLRELAIELMAPFSLDGHEIVTVGGIQERLPSSVLSPNTGTCVPLKEGHGDDPFHYWLED